MTIRDKWRAWWGQDKIRHCGRPERHSRHTYDVWDASGRKRYYYCTGR